MTAAGAPISQSGIKLTSPDPQKGLGNDPLAQRFRRIFDNVRNYCRRGVSFARVVQQVDKLHFSSETDVIVLSPVGMDVNTSRADLLPEMLSVILELADCHENSPARLTRTSPSMR